VPETATGSFGGGASAAASVADRLGLRTGSPGRRYVEELGRVRLDTTPPGRLPPFDSAAAERLCARLGCTGEDIADVIETLPSPERAPAWWWCLERASARLIDAMGDVGAPRGRWPGFEGPEHSRERRCHVLHVALAVVPRTIAFLTGAGVTEQVAWASLHDVARHAAIHRRVHRLTGLEADWWVVLSLRGELVELGRLQFHRFVLGRGGESPPWYARADAAAHGEGFRIGDECIGVHIPEGGPLAPELVDASLETAGRFFATHFVSGKRRVATCRSWLLDPQLADYLPEGSNIVRFQRRFTLVPGAEKGDGDVVGFVFRAAGDGGLYDLDALPQRTTLERAVVRHLRDGGHWECRTGWLDLPGL
jgi:GNAT-like C-terminal domain/N-acyltransferase N-terminal domain